MTASSDLMRDRASAHVMSSPPFDAAALDALLGERGIDVLVATSPHNVQYLLGGYRFFFFEHADAIGVSRYLPVLVYRPGRPADALYVGAGNEDWGTDVRPLWVPEVRNVAWSAAAAARAACDHLGRLQPSATVGIEPAFLPHEAARIIARELPRASLVDATEALESLRAVKTDEELELIRTGSTGVVDAMLATFASVAVGATKADVAERLRREQTDRGLVHEYCLIAAGSDHNRAPSSQRVERGDVVSLDSGAQLGGYVADLARMGIVGAPTARHEDLLAQVEHVQLAARGWVRAGARGGDVFEVAERALADCPERGRMRFLAHGCGLVTHEAPRLTATGSPPYPAAHADKPLQAGMVLSLETHLADPEAGFVKLEDTVIVTRDGVEPVADHGRGWNCSEA